MFPFCNSGRLEVQSSAVTSFRTSPEGRASGARFNSPLFNQAPNEIGGSSGKDYAQPDQRAGRLTAIVLTANPRDRLALRLSNALSNTKKTLHSLAKVSSPQSSK